MKAMNMNYFGNKEQQLLSQNKQKGYNSGEQNSFKTWTP